MTTPLITFKAGQCEYDAEAGATVKPDPTPGYIYITQDDDLHHFCWRPRSVPHTEPKLDLLMLPTDATFTPYRPKDAKTTIRGRIYVLKFSSSSVKHLFWLQSGPSKPSDPSSFSARDLKIGEIVNAILQGEEIDVSSELRDLPPGNGGGGGRDDDDDDDDEDDDDDTAMEDADAPGSGSGLHRAASGGAGAGATGGDIREEGEDAREGGADGGRATHHQQSTARATTSSRSANPAPPQDATQAAITNFLRSLQGANLTTSQPTYQQQHQAAASATNQLFTTLSDLLHTTTTLPILETLPSAALDGLLSHLPPQVILSASASFSSSTSSEPSTISSTEIAEITDPEIIAAISMSLSDTQKRRILAKILRSPQFSQACASLTHALRDGGLPAVSEGLGVEVENGGFLHGNARSGSVPMGGGMAVRAFVEGYRLAVLRKAEGEKDRHGDGDGDGDGEGNMDVDG